MELHEINTERLLEEQDIVTVIEQLRVTTFLSYVHTHDYQRYFINKFNIYNICADNE